MERANSNARIVAEFLRDHPRVEEVHYLPFLPADVAQRRIYEAQCSGPGSTFSFDIRGGLQEAFGCLNRMQIFKLAVSLVYSLTKYVGGHIAGAALGTEVLMKPIKQLRGAGGTESLACHPGTTTHSGVPTEVRCGIGIRDTTIRLSIEIEHPDDLLADLSQALAAK